MYATETLDIAGHRGEQVPHTFFRQEGGADHLAIVLPGFGYTCDMPLLYYSVRALLDARADVLQVEYAYNQRKDFRRLPDEERRQWLITDAAAACDAVLRQGTYPRVTLIGKSIGTRAMGHLLTTDARLARAHAVWLTPLLRDSHLRAQMQQHCPSLFVVGTNDPYYDASLLAEVRDATGGETVVVEGGDHSLEIAGNVQKSLDALAVTTRALQTFLTVERQTRHSS